MSSSGTNSKMSDCPLLVLLSPPSSVAEPSFQCRLALRFAAGPSEVNTSSPASLRIRPLRIRAPFRRSFFRAPHPEPLSGGLFCSPLRVRDHSPFPAAPSELNTSSRSSARYRRPSGSRSPARTVPPLVHPLSEGRFRLAAGSSEGSTSSPSSSTRCRTRMWSRRTRRRAAGTSRAVSLASGSACSATSAPTATARDSTRGPTSGSWRVPSSDSGK